MAPHSSTLACKIPWIEEPGGLQSMGLLRVRHNFTFTFHFHALEKEMATHSSVLAWRIPGMGEPGGLPSMGLHRVGHDWSDLAAVAAADSHPRLPLGSMSEALYLHFENYSSYPVHEWGFPGGSTGKESTCKVGDLGSIPRLGRSPGEENGYPLQYSGLENSMDCIVHGVTKSRTWLNNFHFTSLNPVHE